MDDLAEAIKYINSLPPLLSYDTMKQITFDVLHKVSPEDSQLEYTEQMLKFRAATEKDIEEHPNAIVDIPYA